MLIPTSRGLQQRKRFCDYLGKPDVVDRIIHDILTGEDLQTFYNSQVLLRLSAEHGKSVLEWIKQTFQDDENLTKVEFLETALSQLRECEAVIAAAGRNLHVEDILQHFEFLLARARHLRVGVDGGCYDEQVIDSQHDHLASVFSDAIGLIFDWGIQPSGRKKGQPRKCQEFGFALGRRRAIRSTIIEVLMGGLFPVRPSRAYELGLIPAPPISCSYFLAHYPDYWRHLEIYRDLNIGYQTHKAAPPNVLQELLRKSDLVSLGPTSTTARVDLSKVGDAVHALKFHNIGQILGNIYGGHETVFVYEDREYSIGDIIRVAEKISLASERVEAATLNGGTPIGKFYVLGRRSLIRFLDLTDKESRLLDLFCADGEEGNDPRFMPLVRVGQTFYLAPSLIVNQCYDKVVDKILSRAAISWGDGQAMKGGTFEAELERLVKSSGYKWGKTNQDQKKDVPEIDGAFPLAGKWIVVYEAKCSVKPEERSDAYRFVENHLTRAVDQLAKRISYLRRDPHDASRRLGFAVEDCEILPLLITNHPYFTGLEALTPDGDKVYVLDRDLLCHIIAERIIPSWTYDAKQEAYVRSESSLDTGEEIVEAIRRPWRNLQSFAPCFIQVTEGGIATLISSTPTFDDSQI